MSIIFHIEKRFISIHQEIYYQEMFYSYGTKVRG